MEFDGDVTEHRLSINIYDNMIYEGDKSFGIQLYLVSGTGTLISPSAMVITITEDDQPPSKDGIHVHLLQTTMCPYHSCRYELSLQ